MISARPDYRGDYVDGLPFSTETCPKCSPTPTRWTKELAVAVLTMSLNRSASTLVRFDLRYAPILLTSAGFTSKSGDCC